ncbi:MAG: ATP-dependent Clp protease adaptor ClpS [Planctomycetota bacterium]
MGENFDTFGNDSGFGEPGFDQSGIDFGPLEGEPSTATKVRPQPKSETDREQPVPWNVVLLDDDDHSYEYVIRMGQQLFGMSLERAFMLAKTVDSEGRAVCTTTHKELAELKQEQIHSFGPDPLMQRSTGAMSAIIEPAQGGDEPGDDSDDLNSNDGELSAD